jgi:hypothetical protein
MVLQRRNDDLVARLEARAKRARHQVDPFGGAAHKDDFGQLRRIDERTHFLPRAFVELGGVHGEGMDAAVHVGVVVLVEIGDGVDDGARLLRRRRVVQVHQRLAVDFLRQRRKIGPHFGDVEHGGGGCGGVGHDRT